MIAWASRSVSSSKRCTAGILCGPRDAAGRSRTVASVTAAGRADRRGRTANGGRSGCVATPRVPRSESCWSRPCCSPRARRRRRGPPQRPHRRPPRVVGHQHPYRSPRRRRSLVEGFATAHPGVTVDVRVLAPEAPVPVRHRRADLVRGAGRAHPRPAWLPDFASRGTSPPSTTPCRGGRRAALPACCPPRSRTAASTAPRAASTASPCCTTGKRCRTRASPCRRRGATSRPPSSS